LNICCISRAAQALAPRVALFFQFKSIVFLLPEPEAKIFNLAMTWIMRKYDVISINWY